MFALVLVTAQTLLRPVRSDLVSPTLEGGVSLVGPHYLIKHIKIKHKTVAVPTEAPPQQQQGPLYEEVAPAIGEEIELKTNEAHALFGQCLYSC